MSIRYALVRHRHNNGQLSDDRVYIPVNVPMYAGCYYAMTLLNRPACRSARPRAGSGTARWCVFGRNRHRHEPAGLERNAG